MYLRNLIPISFHRIKWILKVFILLTAFILAFVIIARADVVIPDNLWKGLIAEDVAGGYQGMYAVACCVRNRLNSGLNTGLVALKRRDLDEFVRREGRQTEYFAKDIVRKVFAEGAPDITRGATHYENIEAYGLPKWARSMVRTIRIGEHTYFRKERKN